MGYNFLDEENSGYTRHKYLHVGGDFGIGIESKSHIESKWGQIKSKIKEIYHIIPPKQFILFVNLLKNANIKLSLKI